MPATTARSVNSVRTGPRGSTPVVLVHPVGLDLTYCAAQIEALSDAHAVVAFDLPGHGSSPGEPADWTLGQAAEMLARVIRSSGSEGAHVIGVSVGGMIAQAQAQAQALALAEPDRVRSLVLIDTAAAFPKAVRAGVRARAAMARDGGMPAVLPSTIERWFTPDTAARRPDLIDRVSKTLLADDPAIHAAMWDMIAELDLVAQLHRIACPTLILVGEHDPSSPPAAARVLQDNIAGAELHVVPDASHMAVLERPDVINGHISRFLSGLPARRTERSPASSD